MQQTILSLAELQYRFAIAMVSHVLTEGPVSGLIHRHTAGVHTLNHAELTFTAEQETRASFLLQQSAAYLMMQQLDRELALKHGDRRLLVSAGGLYHAAWITRLIRNAFAHDSFAPIWLIDRRVLNRSLEVPGIVRLDTKKLRNQPVQASDFGGYPALLALLRECASRHL